MIEENLGKKAILNLHKISFSTSSIVLIFPFTLTDYAVSIFLQEWEKIVSLSNLQTSRVSMSKFL